MFISKSIFVRNVLKPISIVKSNIYVYTKDKKKYELKYLTKLNNNFTPSENKEFIDKKITDYFKHTSSKHIQIEDIDSWLNIPNITIIIKE